MKFRMISLFCILIVFSFFLHGCESCMRAVEEQERQQKEEQLKKTTERDETQFYTGDKVIVKIYTPTGEKTYEGTLVRWWEHGVVIKKDGKTLMGIESQFYEIEKQ